MRFAPSSWIKARSAAVCSGDAKGWPAGFGAKGPYEIPFTKNFVIPNRKNLPSTPTREPEPATAIKSLTRLSVCLITRSLVPHQALRETVSPSTDAGAPLRAGRAGHLHTAAHP